MISTHEAISDPVAYIQDNPDLLQTMEQQDFLMLGGTDLDVGIKKVMPYDIKRSGQYTQQESVYLGDAYRSGEAYGLHVAGNEVDIAWYPSAQATNQLGSQLGMTPGVDMLRFTHAEADKVPAADYVAYIARGEFPQSTKSWGYFNHDRSGDHVPGVLVMPPKATEAVIAYAGRVLQKGSKNPVALDEATLAVDSTTSIIGLAAYWHVQNKYHKAHTTAQEILLKGNMFKGHIHAKQFGYTESRRVSRNMQQFTQDIVARLTELEPVLTELQSECPTAVSKG